MKLKINYHVLGLILLFASLSSAMGIAIANPTQSKLIAICFLIGWLFSVSRSLPKYYDLWYRLHQLDRQAKDILEIMIEADPDIKQTIIDRFH